MGKESWGQGLVPWGPGEPESLISVPGDTGKPGTRALGMWTLLPGSNCAQLQEWYRISE